MLSPKSIMVQLYRGDFAVVMIVSLSVALCAVSTVQAQTFTVVHSFTGGSDGGNPYAGVTLDQAGNLYGTTLVGGAGSCGTVFRLQRRASADSVEPV